LLIQGKGVMETFFLIGLSGGDGSEKSLYKEYRMKDERATTKKNRKVDEAETSKKIPKEEDEESIPSILD